MAFPWLSIIMAVLSFITSKKSGSSTQKAALIGAAAGLGTYYVTHNTEWGVKNLGQFDGVPGTTGPSTDATTTTNSGVVVPTPPTSTTSPSQTNWYDGAWKTLQEWGPAGTALVGATVAGTASGSLSKWLPWVFAGLAAYVVLH